MTRLKQASLFLLLVVFTFCARAQKEDTSNNNLEFYLSYTNPAFFVSQDTSLRSKNFSKSYSLTSYLYDEAIKKSSSEFKGGILDSLALYIKKRYVAEQTIKRITASVLPSEAEVLHYYQTHTEEYALPAVCSFFQIFVLKEDKATIEAAKKKVLQLASIPDGEKVFKGDKNSDFSISYESNVKLMPSYRITSLVGEVKLQQFTDLLQIEGYQSKVMYYVVSRTPKQAMPFAEVKQDCYSRARTKKQDAIFNTFYQKALESYPVPLR